MTAGERLNISFIFDHQKYKVLWIHHKKKRKKRVHLPRAQGHKKPRKLMSPQHLLPLMTYEPSGGGGGGRPHTEVRRRAGVVKLMSPNHTTFSRFDRRSNENQDDGGRKKKKVFVQGFDCSRSDRIESICHKLQV